MMRFDLLMQIEVLFFCPNSASCGFENILKGGKHQ